MQLFREAVSLTTSISLEFAQAGIVAWAGNCRSPFTDVHFPFWAAKACDGKGGRMRLTLMCSTMAAQVEFTGLRAAALALINSSAPPCSQFDLSRWGLLEVALAVPAQASTADTAGASSSADAARSRSRSPPPAVQATKGAKSGGKGGSKNHGRSGLEPVVIELLGAYYSRNWVKVGQLCDKIWHLRPNIQKHIHWK